MRRGFGAARPAAAAPAPAAPAAAKAGAKAKADDLPPLAADEIDEEDVLDGGESDDELSEEDKQAFEADLLAAEKRARAAMALQRVRGRCCVAMLFLFLFASAETSGVARRMTMRMTRR